MVFLCSLGNNALLRSRKTAEGTHVPLVRPLAAFLDLKRALFSYGGLGTPSSI